MPADHDDTKPPMKNDTRAMTLVTRIRHEAHVLDLLYAWRGLQADGDGRQRRAARRCRLL